MQKNRWMLSFGFLLGLLCLLSPVRAEDGEGDTGAEQTESVWVTSIAQRGGSGEFVAATANGLLLREADVVSFQADRPDQLKSLYQHPAAVWCVDASADGNLVVSVDYRGNLMTYDVAAGKAETHEKAFERWCPAMMLSPDDKLVIAGNEAGKIMVWDLAAGKVTGAVELKAAGEETPEGHAVWGLALSPDGSQLAASDGGGHVHLIKFPLLEAIGEIKVCEDTLWCVAYANDGAHLFAGSSDRNLYRFEAKPDAEAQSVAKGTDWITEIAVSSGGQIAAAEVGGRLHFPSLGGTDSMDAESGVWSLCWNGDEQLFAGTRKTGIAIAGRSWKWTEPVIPEPPAAEPEKPAEEKPAEEKPAEEKPAAEKPAEEKPAAEKPTEENKKDAPADEPKDE